MGEDFAGFAVGETLLDLAHDVEVVEHIVERAVGGETVEDLSHFALACMRGNLADA